MNTRCVQGYEPIYYPFESTTGPQQKAIGNQLMAASKGNSFYVSKLSLFEFIQDAIKMRRSGERLTNLSDAAGSEHGYFAINYNKHDGSTRRSLEVNR